MALAEARAAWQRTANRCLVQEDAKRAPKLACCSSMPPCSKDVEKVPTAAQDIPTIDPPPFHQNPSYSNLSPNSRWWLQLPANYGYQKGLMDKHVRGDAAGNKDDSSSGLVDQTSSVEFPFDDEYRDFITCEEKGFGYKGETLSEISKNTHDVYFDSESSWIRGERNTPWWRTADTEELALLVAQRSLECVENCDLPSPQNSRAKKDLDFDISKFGVEDRKKGLDFDFSNFGAEDRNFDAKGQQHFQFHDCVPGGTTPRRSCQNLRVSAEGKSASGADKLLRDSAARKIHVLEDDTGKSKLLEALRHSQTRAREAEKVAKQASAEKEHVVKLVFRQAMQLFAYKQLLHLLQLENMYFHLKSNISQSPSPVMLPWTPLKTRKTRKGWQKSWGRKCGKKPRPRHNVGRYAVAFALGLGLVGAGLFLGWTIGWMLPTW